MSFTEKTSLTAEAIPEKDQSTISARRKALPPNVIQRIFIFFITPCHRHPHDKCKRLSCRNSFPLLLGKICKEWRNIAWNLPVIWSWINIPVTPDRSDEQLELVKDWLQRAKDQPLSIIVRPAPSRSMKVYAKFSPQTPEIFKLIVDYSTQWRALEIESTPLLIEFLEPAYGRTPILETVFIHSAETQFTKPTLLAFLGNAPNLRSLFYLGTNQIGGITYPWTNLTSFRCESATLAMLKFLCEFAPNVQQLNLQFKTLSKNQIIDGADPNSGTGQDALSDDRWNLPRHLISLTITGWITSQYVKHMKAPPTLERLTIIQYGKEDLTQYSFNPIIDFIDRAKCTLRAFGISIEVLPIDVQSLHELFTKLHSVKRLYINSKVTANYSAMMRQIPRMLDPYPNPALSTSTDLDMSRPLLPCLEVLYYCTVDTGLKSQHLIDMIKHRCKGTSNSTGTDIAYGGFVKLKIVRFNKTNPKILLEALQEEINQGLQMTYDLPYEGEPFK
ncbi:hypothetical protein JR316_0013058 [Psilocybe cubensis]|uniref:Uncharacterized protein n=2 Tax=Psilocybe cubensis TaxID=181762 RepID=A0ACB8GHB4_PSICU|nr:hypothetical protein JR316_0013058 [Psilocybe cubensis]KAH9474596.1 hypothetical protein JR316_0013058 [Psilocybe cubensis]